MRKTPGEVSFSTQQNDSTLQPSSKDTLFLEYSDELLNDYNTQIQNLQNIANTRVLTESELALLHNIFKKITEFSLNELKNRPVYEGGWQEEAEYFEEDPEFDDFKAQIAKVLGKEVSKENQKPKELPSKDTFSDLEYAEMMDRGDDSNLFGEIELARLINIATKTKDPTFAPLIFSLFDQNIFFPAINRDIAEYFSEVQPHEAAAELLRRIRETKPKTLSFGYTDKAFYARILYWMEMGQVSVTQGMFEYLQKKYKLIGEGKNETISAIRITPDGKLGLLNEKNELIGYIEFGEFENTNEKEALIMEISTELLMAKQNVSETEQTELEEHRENFLKEYHAQFFQKFIVAESGVPFNNLSLREQFWFYRFLKEKKDNPNTEKILTAAKKFKEPFLKTFIALSFDNSADTKILSLLEKYNDKTLQILFEKFSAFVDAGEYVEKEVQKFFVNATDKNADSQKVSGEMFQRGVDLLNSFASQTIENPNEKLQKLNHEIVIFAGLFKTLFDLKNKVDFSEVQGLKLQIKSLSELIPEEKNQMEEIIFANWVETAKTPEQKTLGETVVAGFKKYLESTTYSELYILKKDNKIISFLRFDEIPGRPGHKYAGSFNVDPQLRGSAIGSAVMEETLMREQERSVLEATVNPNIDVAMNYVEEIGFVITKTLPNYLESGNTFFEIQCDKKMQAAAISRQVSIEDIVTHNLFDFFVFADADKTAAVQKVEAMTREGYMVTRYSRHPEQKGQRVMVFEQIPMMNQQPPTELKQAA